MCVCGAFGQYLNPRNAQAIGLLPEIAAERIELCGNTALAGCERLLFSEAAAASLTSLRQRAAVINLSQRSDFDEPVSREPVPTAVQGPTMKLSKYGEPELFQSFLKSAQYIARIKTQQDAFEELGKLVVAYFPATWVAFGQRVPGGISVHHCTPAEGPVGQ